MTLLYSEVEDELRAAVRQVLGDRSPWRAVLARTESDEPHDRSLWRTLAMDIGVAGLAVPEKLGGAGASWRETAVVAEELGRAVAPVPYLGGVMATAALLAGGDTSLLPDVASGERTAVLVLPLSTPPAAPVPSSVRAVDGALTGTVTSVADALVADVLVVPTPEGLFAVDAASCAPVVSLDLTRPLCDVTFRELRASLITSDPQPAWGAALTVGAAMLASEQLGVAGWCLQTTVEYVKTRYQFGRPIGSYQGLKHRLAELWVALTQARAVARYAAGCVSEDDPDAAIAACMAQSVCGPVAVRAAEECVQMHAGVGFTWEHPAHLYLKRAKSAAIALGTAERHRSALSVLADLPA